MYEIKKRRKEETKKKIVENRADKTPMSEEQTPTRFNKKGFLKQCVSVKI